MKKTFITKNFYLFPFLLGFSLFISLLESYKYFGFLVSHVHIPSLTFYVLTIFSFTTICFSKISLLKIRASKRYQVFLILTTCLFVIILGGYLFLNELDVIHYKNYSFVKFHLQAQNLLYVLAVLIAGPVLYFITNIGYMKIAKDLSRSLKNEFLGIYNIVLFPDEKKISISWTKFLNQIKVQFVRQNNPLLISVLLLTIFGSYNLFKSSKDLLDNDVYIFTHLKATYNEKMEAQWGFLYHLVEVILDKTADRSIILFPPGIAPWTVVANIDQVKIFMGNRKLVSSPGANEIIKDVDYVIIARGGLHVFYDIVKSDKEYGWPKVFVPAKTIWYIDKNSGAVTEFHKDFDPIEPFNKNAWGLIEVDRTRLK